MKWLLICSVVIVGISLTFIKQSKNNVCKTFEDYYTDRDQNENCYYNPDDELPVPEIIKRWGYPVETHHAITKDGFILTMFRIPHGKNSTTKKPGQPVFVQHGYKSNSKCFVITGKKSLGFILADQGYDVWLGNFRGTVYSRNHTHLKESDEAFWAYSFHEIGVYDIPAQVDVVHDVTKQKIIYLGYSMGTTAATIYSSTYPDIAESKVKIFIKLAPFIFIDGMTLFARTGLTLWQFITPVAQALTHSQFYTEHFIFINAAVSKLLCYPYPFQMRICQIFEQWSFGLDYEQNDPETLPVTLFQNNDRSSIQTVSHISQLMLSGKFQQFDYGVKENINRYGSPQPPLYNFSRMRVPTYILRGENDLTSTKQSIEKFNALLPEQVKPYDIYVVNHDKFNHIDFLCAKDVVPLLYDHLMNFMSTL